MQIVNGTLNSTEGGQLEATHPMSIMNVVFAMCQFLLSVIGLIGNSQICLFYVGKKDKTPSECIILNLGVVDLIYCLCCVLSTLNDKICEVVTQQGCDTLGEDSSLFLKVYKASGLGLFTFVTNYSYICIFIITINRYFAVRKPVTYKVICTFKVSYLLLIAGQSPSLYLSLSLSHTHTHIYTHPGLRSLLIL